VDDSCGLLLFFVIILIIVAIAFFDRPTQLLATGRRRSELFPSTPMHRSLRYRFCFLLVIAAVLLVVGRWSHPHQGLPSSALDRTDRRGWLVVIVIAIVVVIIIVVLQLVVIIVVITVVVLGSVGRQAGKEMELKGVVSSLIEVDHLK
jgi:hypothetical protein